MFARRQAQHACTNNPSYLFCRCCSCFVSTTPQGGLQAAMGIVNGFFTAGNVDTLTPGGTSLRFSPRTPRQLQFPASKFVFSNNNGRHRLHSVKHVNKMLFFLGLTKPREWVVWNDNRDADNGDWEVLEIIWDGAKIKLKGHHGQYPRWNGQYFEATRNATEATEFVLHRF